MQAYICPVSGLKFKMMEEVLDYCFSDGIERAIAGKEALQDKTTLQVRCVDVSCLLRFLDFWDRFRRGYGLRISPLPNASCIGKVRVAQAEARVGARDQGRG